MESELPILLYLFSFALAALAREPDRHLRGLQNPLQIPSRRQPDPRTPA
ncbi:hypothetical protein RKLH11_947 [Rhodobacteraceae bacterium KLH11]|nr:hypothetical protein RKLH11_947 [Rhodobacteraceae bacterium KLH11]